MPNDRIAKQRTCYITPKNVKGSSSSKLLGNMIFFSFLGLVCLGYKGWQRPRRKSTCRKLRTDLEIVCKSNQHRVVTKPESIQHKCKLLKRKKHNHITEHFVCKMTNNQLGHTHSPSSVISGAVSPLWHSTVCLGCFSQPAWVPGLHSAFRFRLRHSVQHQVSWLWFPRGGWWQVYWSPGTHLAWHVLHLRGMFLAGTGGSDFLRRGKRDPVGPGDQPSALVLSTLAFWYSDHFQKLASTMLPGYVTVKPRFITNNYF